MKGSVELEENNVLVVRAVHVFAHVTDQQNGGCQPSRDPKVNEENPYRIVRGNSCNTISATQVIEELKVHKKLSRDWDEAANSILPEPHPDLRLV